MIFRRILNLCLWLNVCLLGGTGALLYWRLPPGSRGGQGLSLLGMTRHEWGDVHAIAGFVFAALVLAHLALAWQWLKVAAAKKKLWPVYAGLASGALIVIGFLAVPVEQDGASDAHSDGEHAANNVERLRQGDGQRPRGDGQGGGGGWQGGR